jgi:hypothetical protein
MDDRDLAPTPPATTIRWIARTTGTLFVVVFLAFFIPDWVQKGTMPVPSDRVPMVLSLFLVFIGLTMAWKWEGAGGIVALAGLVAYCVLGLQTDVKPAATVLLTGAYALPAILFVVHGWQARRAFRTRRAGAA